MAFTDSSRRNMDIQNFFRNAGPSPHPHAPPQSVPLPQGSVPPQRFSPFPPEFAPYSQAPPDFRILQGPAHSPPAFPGQNGHQTGSPGTDTPQSNGGSNLQGAHLMALLAPHASQQPHAPHSLPSTPLPSSAPGAEAETEANRPGRQPVSLADILGSSQGSVSSSSSVPPPARLPAMPSAPPAPMAMEGSAPSRTMPSGSSSRTVAKGRVLAGSHIVYDVNVRLPGEEHPQLEVATITVYGSEYVLSPGRQIAVNRRYICYSLRTSTIRILNMDTALRALLRGHSQRVTDMAFFGDNTHLLATASADGRVLARHLSEEAGEDGKLHICEHLIFAIQLQGPWGSDPVCPIVCWHPESQDSLIVACAQYVLLINPSLVGREGGAPSIEAPLFCSVDSPPPGVTVLAGHQRPVTSLMEWPHFVKSFASPSKDGTVRIWDPSTRMCTSTIVPHDTQPVYSATFLMPPGSPYSSPLLLTGGPMNQQLRLWAAEHPGSLDSWSCIQTLDLQASSDAGPVPDSFFNQIGVVHEVGLILIANVRKQAVYAIHLQFGAEPEDTRMDYLAEFEVTYPILSFTALMEPGAESPGRVQMYCVQTSAIQLYSLDVAACLPPEEEVPVAPQPSVAAPDSLENPQVPVEPAHGQLPPAIAALAKAHDSAAFGSPVETSRTSRPVPSHGLEEVSEASVSGPADVTTTSDVVTSVIEEVTAVSSGDAVEVTKNVQEVEETKVVISSHEGGTTAVSETSVLTSSDVVASSAAMETIPSAPPLSTSQPPEEEVKEAPASGPPVSTEVPEDGHAPPGASLGMTLLTPAHFMSLAESSQGEPSSMVPPPSAEAASEARIPEQIKELTGVEPPASQSPLLASDVTPPTPPPTPAIPESPVLQEDTSRRREGSLEGEVMEAAIASSMESGTAGFPNEAEGAAAPAQEAEATATEALAAPGGTDAEPAKPATEQRDVEVPVPTTAGPPLPAVASGAAPAGTQAAPSKARKNKNKAAASAASAAAPQAPAANPSPPAPAAASPAAGDLEPGSSTSQALTNGLSAGPSDNLQEGVDQLLAMHREFSNKVAMLVAVPVAKEGKRIEAALGTKLERALKAHADAQWARLQEDAAKREKAERERMQQTASAVVASLAKEMQPAIQQTVKKEVSLIAPAIARLVTPTMESSLSSISTDLLQKLGPQVESSIASQVELAVSRHVASHFQTTVHTALQESLKACFQSSVIPAFESACRNMFEQIDVTLQRGLGEHTGAAQQQLVASHSALATSLQETMASASAVVAQLGEEITEGQRKLVALAEQAAASAGSAAGPLVPTAGTVGSISDRALSLLHVEETLDPTRELTRLLGEHKYEEAFNRALTLADVAIVAWLCSQIDPAVVFSGGTVGLSQSVLLSLVQQLGCDLSHDTERKLLWLRNAVLALNPMHPQLAPHMRPILQQLYQNLHRHLPLCSEPVASDMRLVIHVVNSLLMSCK